MNQVDWMLICIFVVVIYVVNPIYSLFSVWIRSFFINKNMYNWITFSDFGNASVLLSTISKDKKIKFKKNQAWINFIRLDVMFKNIKTSERELMEDYLLKTTRKFKYFEDKAIDKIFTSIQISGVVSGTVGYLKAGDFTLFIINGMIMILFIRLIKKYEKERNARDLLLMLIERAKIHSEDKKV